MALHGQTITPMYVTPCNAIRAQWVLQIIQYVTHTITCPPYLNQTSTRDGGYIRIKIFHFYKAMTSYEADLTAIHLEVIAS